MNKKKIVKDSIYYKQHTIRFGGELLDLSKPRVMGILNITPDSFYDGGKYSTLKDILLHTEKMLSEGTDIIDIGAISTKPGAIEISEEKEMERLIPVLKEIRKQFPKTIISIDTFRHGIAERAIESGAHIINDISGGTFDNKMFETIAHLKVPYILMHIQGTPQTMQIAPSYHNITHEIISYFAEKIMHLKNLGVADIIIDPGFGFGKTIAHNYEIMKHLEDFKLLEMPILMGVSRKSMIYKLLNISPNEALNGTTTLHSIALLKGANILRVHDVKEAVEVVKIMEMMNLVRFHNKKR